MVGRVKPSITPCYWWFHPTYHDVCCWPIGQLQGTEVHLACVIDFVALQHPLHFSFQLINNRILELITAIYVIGLAVVRYRAGLLVNLTSLPSSFSFAGTQESWFQDMNLEKIVLPTYIMNLRMLGAAGNIGI